MCGRWQELKLGGEPAPGGAAAFNALAAAAGWAEGTVHNGGSLSMRLANSLGEAAAGMAEYARRLVEDASNTAAAAACLRDAKGPRPPLPEAVLRIAEAAVETLWGLSLLSSQTCLAAAQNGAAASFVAMLDLFAGLQHAPAAICCDLLRQSCEALPLLLAAHPASRAAAVAGGESDFADAANRLLARLPAGSRPALQPLLQRATDALQGPNHAQAEPSSGLDALSLEQQLALIEGAALEQRPGGEAATGGGGSGGAQAGRNVDVGQVRCLLV